ncbi:hypothetical protein GY45DRAFT_1328720 [Cubamyces sp. BRFM 1775]|nr:hypothetical protein GY45DRAFT_1328720 [Cubamyces sp. BRFM 1775]
MAARIRELGMNRTSSYQKDRTSGSHNHDLNNFSHLRGPNPSYADHPDVDGNPFGHVRSIGPTSANAESEPATDPASTPTEEDATTPTSEDKAYMNDDEQDRDAQQESENREVEADHDEKLSADPGKENV